MSSEYNNAQIDISEREFMFKSENKKSIINISHYDVKHWTFFEL